MRALFAGSALLVGLSAVSYVAARLTSTTPVGPVLDEVAQNLSVGLDLALPTWYAIALWALLGLIAAAHGASNPVRRRSWILLAAVAWLASVDEFLMLHERLSKPAKLIEQWLGFDLGATWVLVGLPVAVIVAVLLWPLVRSLTPLVRRDLIAGAALFLLGAVGFEVLQQELYPGSGGAGWLDAAANHIEEALEFVGLVFAIRGLVRVLPLEFTTPTTTINEMSTTQSGAVNA